MSDLTKEACLAAIRGVTSRRVLPKVIYSSNATNLIGSRNELLRIQQIFAPHDSHKEVENFCANKGNSNPCKIVLNFEELTNILAQIQQILNSRPLTPLSTDPNDLQVLTPGHFLAGSSLTALADNVQDDCALVDLRR